MKQETLLVENMVCPRCITAVTKELEELGWDVLSVELSKVTGVPPRGWPGNDELKKALAAIGFKLAEEGSVMGRIKGVIIDYVYQEQHWPNRVLSDILAEALNRSYGHLSRSFSEEAGRTIEDYYQAHRIERARQLLHQTKLPVSEIATLLRYGTAAHFSNSFRQHTDQSPSIFRKAGKYKAIDLSKV